MCGIAGFYSKKYTLNNLKEMANVLSHRGPDNKAHFFDTTLSLGLSHNRLSIIDTSAFSNQPLVSKCGRYVMVYNGEIYNFKALSKKYNLSTNISDTHVLLELFILLKKDLLIELEGMFAFAIFDKKQQVLSLFRDFLGIKPLYYVNDKNSFAFSSEIKALKQLENNYLINDKAISDFFSLGFVTGTDTIYKEIKQLDSGSYLTFNLSDNIVIRKYWDIAPLYSKNSKYSFYNFNDAANQIEEKLFEAVQKRLISVQPLGIFLSGGVDSSLITAMAKKYQSSLDTFSVGFKHQKFDESTYAQQVALKFKTNHNHFYLDYDDTIHSLEKLITHIDQPFVDTSLLPTFLLSEFARKKVNVILSGEGADELFYGYGTYKWARILDNSFIWKLRHPIASFLRLGNNRLKRIANVLDSSSYYGKSPAHIFSQEQYLFSHKEFPLLLNNEFVEAPKNYNFINSAMKKQSYFEIENYLKNNLLVKVDRASMRAGLEARVPFLDRELVEMAINLPDKFKYKNGQSKYILKHILNKYLPPELVNRPKWGFSIPLAEWMKNQLKPLVDNYLSDELLEANRYINSNYVKRLKHNFYNGQDYLYHRLWQVVVFNLFLDKNGYF